MVAILLEAQELVDVDVVDGEILGGELVGDNMYFISCGRTRQSAFNNAIKYFNKMWYYYEYFDHGVVNVPAKKAEVIEIDRDRYDELMEEIS